MVSGVRLTREVFEFLFTEVLDWNDRVIWVPLGILDFPHELVLQLRHEF